MALLSLPFFWSQRPSRSLITVTKNHFLSYVCIKPEIDPIAQQSVFKFLEDHALPFTWIEKIVVEIVQFNQCFIEYSAIKYQDPYSSGCRGCSHTHQF